MIMIPLCTETNHRDTYQKYPHARGQLLLRLEKTGWINIQQWTESTTYFKYIFESSSMDKSLTFKSLWFITSHFRKVKEKYNIILFIFFTFWLTMWSTKNNIKIQTFEMSEYSMECLFSLKAPNYSCIQGCIYTRQTRRLPWAAFFRGAAPPHRQKGHYQ